ncbi:MAG: MASE1 domain-containing protein, partial [Planctomycetota bacterium]
MKRAESTAIATALRFAPAYFIALHVERLLGAGPEHSPTVGYAHGIAFGAALLLPYRHWPVLAVSMFIASALVAPAWGAAWFPDPVLVLSPLLGAAGLRFAARRTDGSDEFTLRRTSDFLTLALVGVFAAPTLTTAIELAVRPNTSAWTVWQDVGISTGLGTLLLVPVAVTWSQHSRFKLQERLALDTTVTLLTTGLVAPLVFLPAGLEYLPNAPYLILPVVLWCAFRLRLEIVSLQLLVVSLVASASGYPGWSEGASAAAVQVYVGTIALTALLTNIAASSRRRSDRAASRLASALHESEKREFIARIAAGVAHDFKNDLHVARGWVEELESLLSLDGAAPIDPEMEEALRHAADSIERSMAVTRRLLELGADAPRSQGTTAVAPFLDRSSRSWQSIAGARCLLKLEATELGGLRVSAAPNELERALLNLVINARDSMPKGGTISIGAQLCVRGEPTTDERFELPPGRYVEFWVADEGVGISESTRRRIFEPFFTTKGGSGTGLGLATVEAFARQSGGAARADAVKPRGTRLTVIIPAAEPDASTAGADSASEGLP